jgi:hypothetical protein
VRFRGGHHGSSLALRLAVAAGVDGKVASLPDELERFHDHELVKEKLLSGMDMNHINTESKIRTKCKETAERSIGDYVKESGNLSRLQNDICECDSMLERMETMLMHFQQDLGTISADIATLQDSSKLMTQKLSNRRAAAAHLTTFVAGMALDRNLIVNICEGDANETFLAYLLQLNARIEFSRSPAALDSLAARELQAEFDKLKQKAVSKVRSFLLQKVGTLSLPKTNFQILQQGVLMKYCRFVRFLKQESRECFDELKAFYSETMSRVLVTNFRGYIRSLLRLQHGGAKSELLGSTSEDARGLFAMAARLPFRCDGTRISQQ